MQWTDRVAAGPASSPLPPSVPPPILEEDDRLDGAAATVPARLPEQPASPFTHAEPAAVAAAQPPQDAAGKQSDRGAAEATMPTAD